MGGAFEPGIGFGSGSGSEPLPGQVYGWCQGVVRESFERQVPIEFYRQRFRISEALHYVAASMNRHKMCVRAAASSADSSHCHAVLSCKTEWPQHLCAVADHGLRWCTLAQDGRYIYLWLVLQALRRCTESSHLQALVIWYEQYFRRY